MFQELVIGLVALTIVFVIILVGMTWIWRNPTEGLGQSKTIPHGSDTNAKIR